MGEPKPPRGLAAEGRRLWRQVVSEAVEDGLALDARERYWLESACKLTDQAAIIEAELTGADRMVRGSQGQDVINPLVAELRQLRLAADRALGRLKAEPEEPSGVLGIVGSNRQRAAANRRWRGAGA